MLIVLKMDIHNLGCSRGLPSQIERTLALPLLASDRCRVLSSDGVGFFILMRISKASEAFQITEGGYDEGELFLDGMASADAVGFGWNKALACTSYVDLQSPFASLYLSG